MKLKTFLITLIATGLGLGAAPATSDDGNYLQAGQWGFVKVKGGDDRRWRREDDDHDDDDDDDRNRRGKRDDRGNTQVYGNVRNDNAPPVMPRGTQLNFKERLYLERKQQRETSEENTRN